MYWQCPGLGHCREIGLENSEYTCSVLGRYMVGTLSISLQCTCSVLVQYTTPCPQCILVLRALALSLSSKRVPTLSVVWLLSPGAHNVRLIIRAATF